MSTPALHLTDYWLTVLRRTWRGSIVSSFLTPVFYVLAMGVLLGGFVTAGPRQLEGASSYLAFIAPGLVAAHAMTLGIGDMTYPVMGKIMWDKTYQAMLATPLRVRDVVLSEMSYVVLRTAVTCAIFVAVLAAFGVFATWQGAVGAALVQVLVAAAFAGPVYAFSAWAPNESFYPILFRVGMIPMFLFSGAFFPIGNLSAPLEWLARLTPLWHGVDLTRQIALGNLQPGSALLHIAYLAAFAVLGWWLANRLMERRLVS